MAGFFSRPAVVVGAALALRLVLLIYGSFQDAYSPMKYTDIDYYVFTDAARYVYWGRSPYTRDTYRYTPLLAWLLYPTAWNGYWFLFGKVLFTVGDVVAGWLIYLILRSANGMTKERAMKYASIWMLNPMVAQISTRGSSEGLLGVMIMALLWAVVQKRIVLAGALLGFAVHFKIYPFIYAASIFWWLDQGFTNKKPVQQILTPQRIKLALYSLATLTGLNVVMFAIYGWPFLEHSYIYHLVRIDHRHNFSPYNTMLHLAFSPAESSKTRLESLAFIPQLLLSALLLPVALAKKDLPSTMFAQTFAFVTFNKVCTSQYFLWYMVFLPFYLPDSVMLRRPRIGVLALALWVLGQVAWLQQGYQLEFLGRSAFAPGLWAASLLFFVFNIWILFVVIDDVSERTARVLSRHRRKAQ